MVDPGNGATPRPIRQVSVIQAGWKLIYRPVQIAPDIKKSAEIALVLVPLVQNDAKSSGIVVLDHHPADEPTQWKVNTRIAVVGLVFGPHGLDQKKVTSLVRKDEELMAQLAEYAEQTEKVETMIDAVASWEEDKSASKNLDAALSGVAARSGVSVTKIDRTASTDQQAMAMLQSVNPTLSTYDPLTSDSSTRVLQSAGLAASLAGVFLGNPVGLAAGGLSMVQNLRVMMFPDTAFRSALAHSPTPDSLTLCAKRQASKMHTRIAYLWAVRMPNVEAPTITLSGATHLPTHVKSSLSITLANAKQWQTVDRVYDWRLVQASDHKEFPITVHPSAQNKALEIDLEKAAVPTGSYLLAAKWDWSPLQVSGGPVQVVKLDELKAVTLATESADRLVAGSGVVHATLEGADFQFVEKATLRRVDDRTSNPTPLNFALPIGKGAGRQAGIQVDIDTKAQKPGLYLLFLTQPDGKTYELTLRILPPNPKIDNAPLRANLSEGPQTLRLKGSGLNRIERIQTEAAEVSLLDAGKATERRISVRLHPGAKKGDLIELALKVEGLHEPLKVPNVIEVFAPRPKISRTSSSYSEDLSVSVRDGELPAGSFVNFSMSVENAGVQPTIRLQCEDDAMTAAAQSLRPGEKRPAARLEVAGQGMLFLSFDPGAVGQTGCKVMAVVESNSDGRSDPYPLGRVVRLPRIESFTLTDEKLSDGTYAGILKGQDLETIEKTGWNAGAGFAIRDLPTPMAGKDHQQALRVPLSWPSPAPHAPLYIWLRGEAEGRSTRARY
jgi:hypothetical protein